MLWSVAGYVMTGVRGCCSLLVESWLLMCPVVCCMLSFVVSCLFVRCSLLLFVARGVPFTVRCSLCLVRRLLYDGCSSCLCVGAWCLVRCRLLMLCADVWKIAVCVLFMCVVGCCALVVTRCHLLLWLMNVICFVLLVIWLLLLRVAVCWCFVLFLCCCLLCRCVRLLVLSCGVVCCAVCIVVDWRCLWLVAY